MSGQATISDQPSAARDYSPHRRTALVLAGTGTAGAYHAGVLRALREAGVRIDLVAGRGIGAASAIFAAADADARLWDAQGLWTHLPRSSRLYAWRWRWRLLAGGLGLALLALALPLVVAVGLACLYPLVYVMLLVAPDTGTSLARLYADAVGWMLSPALLLDIVPRIATAALVVAAVGVLIVTGSRLARRGPRRRVRGEPWWQALGAPLDAQGIVTWIVTGFWHYLRGAASVPQPAAADLGERYAELLEDNMQQPGYRELMIAVHDIDARTDLVFALLARPRRAVFFGGDRPRAPRRQELHDLAGLARGHLVDVLAAAVTLVPVCDPPLLRFDPESVWQGEAHRVADRPAALGRLLEEVHRAGARQVILACADAPAGGPHALRRARAHPLARLGEIIAAAEVAAARDAAALLASRFDGWFVIQPAHNPIGPLDFRGAYDEASDRHVHLVELMARGYEDTHRQFIDPIVGASGDTLTARPAGGAS